MKHSKKMSILLIFVLFINLFAVQAFSVAAQECTFVAWGRIYNPEGIPADAVLVISDADGNEIGRGVQAVGADERVLVVASVFGNPAGLQITTTTFGAVLEESGFDAGPECGGSASFVAPPHLQDGRINSRSALDIAAPVAVYLDDNTESFDIYVIDPTNGNGFRLLELDAERVEEVGIPAENTLLASQRDPFTGFTVYIYRLSSGEFQINAQYPDGKEYTIIWTA